MIHKHYLILLLTLFILGIEGNALAQQCNLPAPQNLNVQFLVPYEARTSWDPVAGASGYRAIMTNMNSGAMVTKTLTGVNNTSTVFDVQPATFYRIEVNAFCSVGNNSNNVASVEVFSPVYVIVSEIIADKSVNCNGERRFSAPSIGSQTTIPVIFDRGLRFQFECTYLPNPGAKGAYLIRGEIERTESERATFANDVVSSWKLDGQEYQSNYCTNCYTYAKYISEDANASLTMNIGSGGNLFITTSGTGSFTNFILTQCSTGNSGGGGGGDIDGQRNATTGSNGEASDINRAEERTTETTANNVIVIMPNPFETELNIDLGQGRHDFALIQMIDQSGRIVRTVHTTDQNRVTIPADDLSAGLYFLKISTNTLPQRVIKVVKY
ncbi:MAG: T9SS type A sorting domain-containing protein [Saprospiraceae bacterium]|nr:T9SS type A sorting domain-containing protein [Saprospiraceae bacterium]